jgi:NAD(P)-dependent dehydrogenase (short-subunit alcohol dehydrogenase family)
MGDRLFGAPEVQPMMVAMHPIGRWGTPREVSEAVLFMCSERSSFMTGHYIVTDGGFLVGPQAVPGT